MGNPQERSLAWLAAIIEGEGSIGFQVYTLPDKRIRVTPYVGVTNSDQEIIAEVKRLYTLLGAKHRDCKKKLSDPQNGGFQGKKACSYIRADGVKPCRAIVPAILPYIVGEKRHYANAMMEFLDSRDRRGIERNEKGHIRRVEYSSEEIDLICITRRDKRAKSSEAIRRAPNVVG